MSFQYAAQFYHAMEPPITLRPVTIVTAEAGMNSKQIKSKLILGVGSITAAAFAISEKPDAISATIYYHRLNERIRTKLARRFGVRFSKRSVRVNELRKAA